MDCGAAVAMICIVISEESAWKAVVEHDAMADREFVYGVTTTRIYCRPSCSSRRPRRENVRFFAYPEHAEAAGFRACLRCDPKEESVSLSEKARRILERTIDEPPSLELLAETLHVSRFHLQRTFKRTFGLSPKQYVTARQFDHVRQQLKRGADVLTAAYAAGFGSSRRIYERTGETIGMTPGTYRRGGLDIEIRFVTTPTSLGKLLVAATNRGVCAVWFGETDDELLGMLREEFPNARLLPAVGNDLQSIVSDVVAAIEGRGLGDRVPLDIAATLFQMRVWTALRSIPPGATRSYQEIARAIGAPTAARAVGNACARNRVAYLVPCHRAVPAGGGFGGYRWGTKRKEELLRREREDDQKS